MWLSEELRARAGVLAPAATRFLERWLGEQAGSFVGGPPGLLKLCEHMERWLERDDVDEEGERTFVEGAGALLGLLLIDHVGDAAHVSRAGVHRLRLGRFGFFDPFAAVDRALDASNVRKELTRQVALAEAEAASCGPLSRLVCALLEHVERERPDLQLAGQFDRALSLRAEALDDTLEVDLTRAVESTCDQGADAVDAVARKLLSMLPGAQSTSTRFDDVRARLVPRLARAETLRELHGESPSGRLHTSPLSEELVIAMLVEYEGRARYVKQREVEAWGLSPQQLLDLSLHNLAARSEQARIAASDTPHGPLWVARTGDGRDSARVLLKTLYAQLSARVGTRVLVSMPHRDTFFACAADNATLVEELARRTAHDCERAPHKLSTRLFRLTEHGVLE